MKKITFMMGIALILGNGALMCASEPDNQSFDFVFAADEATTGLYTRILENQFNSAVKWQIQENRNILNIPKVRKMVPSDSRERESLDCFCPSAINRTLALLELSKQNPDRQYAQPSKQLRNTCSQLQNYCSKSAAVRDGRKADAAYSFSRAQMGRAALAKCSSTDFKMSGRSSHPKEECRPEVVFRTMLQLAQARAYQPPRLRKR